MYYDVLCAGVPKLRQVTNKRNKTKRKGAAGVPVKDMLSLKNLAVQKYLMPPPSTALSLLPAGLGNVGALVESERGVEQIAVALSNIGATMAVPLDGNKYDVHGQCFTGPIQIGWMLQLLGMPNKFVFHIDGKYKLHHGKFILITLGTHFLRWDAAHTTLSTSFAPLMYLFCREHESTGSALLLCHALDYVTQLYFNAKLQPGASVSDHTDSFKTALVSTYGTVHGSCYPHLKRKWGEGKEYESKKWEHHGEVGEHIRYFNHAHNMNMKNTLVQYIGHLWDEWGCPPGLERFWNSNINADDDWDNWSIGDFDCMLCTPSNQVCARAPCHLPCCHRTTTRPSLLLACSTAGSRVVAQTDLELEDPGILQGQHGPRLQSGFAGPCRNRRVCTMRYA